MSARILSALLAATLLGPAFASHAWAQQAPPPATPTEVVPEEALEPAPDTDDAAAPAPSPAELETAAPKPATTESTAVKPAPKPVTAPPPQPAAPAPVPLSAPPDSPPAPMGPVDQHFTLAVNVDVLWNTDPGFDVFSSDDTATQGGLSAGYAFWVDGPWTLVPELGWGRHVQSSEGLFDGALTSAELDTDTFYASLAARYELFDFVEPHVRLAGGLSWIAATFETDGASFEDHALPPFASAGAGVSIKTRDRMLQKNTGSLATLALALTVEGGYGFWLPAEFELAPTEDPGRIRQDTTSLGELNNSGPYVRVAFSSRF
jgi:hypothetical protein